MYNNNNNNNFGLEKCARICLKIGSVQSKLHVGSTFDNDIKEHYYYYYYYT